MTPTTALGRPSNLPLRECALASCACQGAASRCARDRSGFTAYEAGAGGPRIMWDDVLNEWGPSGMPPAGAATSTGPTKLNRTGYHPKLNPAPLKRPAGLACECGSAAVYGTGSSAHSDWCPASEAR